MDLTRRSCLALGGGASLLFSLGPVGAVLFPPDPPLPPLVAPRGPGIDRTSHVLARLTYGVSPALRREVAAIGLERWIARQLEPHGPDPGASAAVRALETIDLGPAALYEYHPDLVHRQLASARVLRAVHAERQLYEVMVEFWSDHFSIDMGKADCAWLGPDHERQVARQHALGRFAQLVRASLTSPAMLWYLDGRDNRVEPPQAGGTALPPNENHARELLELHTLGVHGGYQQRDVMEVARCLSGWTVRGRHHLGLGTVVFEPEHHDQGAKRILGSEVPAGGGAGDLERVVAILCSHPATATHVAWKLCRRFIADQPPASAVAAVAARFTASGGDISACLETLLAREEFLGEGDWSHLRGSKFKRPCHYLASLLRTTGSACRDGRPLLDHLEILGQTPYRCPTPAGYPEERRAWQDGLGWRWQVADDLVHGRIPGAGLRPEALLAECGGWENLTAHLLGRTPSSREREALGGLDDAQRLALLLASPGFQRC